MAKITRANYLDVVDNVWTQAKKKGIMHIDLDDQYNHGSSLSVKGEELKNFGTCGYMGLEDNAYLTSGSFELTSKNGVQLAISRAYVRPTYAVELEELLSKIFGGRKTLVYSSTSSAHISVLSNVLKDDDLAILDQQVHFSVQYPTKNMKLSGTTVKMIRHNDYDALEDYLKNESNKYNRIWYMADGIYSMHGDTPDMDRLNDLMEKYPKLNCYFDDAHGISWTGSNGSGYIFDKIKFHDRTWLMTTMGKSFGCIGGVAVLPDEEIYRKIDVFGGPLSYSHPLPPPIMGAAIASAKLHLSPLMKVYQDELKELMNYFEARLRQYKIPNVSNDGTPIYFIATGLNRVTRNLIQRILNSGYYVNTATFPVVANDKSGIRISLNRHLTKKDIDGLVKAIAHHFPLAMAEENDSFERLYSDFGLEYAGEFGVKESAKSNYTVEIKNTIEKVDPQLWDLMFKDRGNYCHEGLRAIEEAFTGNAGLGESWEFHYLIIKHNNGDVKLATHFTSGLYKDDMLSHDAVSLKIEVERIKNPKYLCTKTLTMGSLFSEGDFLYLDIEQSEEKKLLEVFFKSVRTIKESVNAKKVILRDFIEGFKFNDHFEDEGYAKIRMPNSNPVITNKWNNSEEYVKSITSKRRRKNIRQFVLKYKDEYEVTIKKSIYKEESDLYFNLYKNVWNSNLGFNLFVYPEKIPGVLAKSDKYEFIEVRLRETQEVVSVVWAYVGDEHYSPMTVGMNYSINQSKYLYKQTVFQIINRSNDLGKKFVHLGFSADFEKRQHGADHTPKFCFIKVDDTFNADVIESISNIKTN